MSPDRAREEAAAKAPGDPSAGSATDEESVRGALGAVFRGFAWLAGGETISRSLSFVATVYVARTLGTAGFGTLGAATALSLYFLLGVQTFDTYGTREMARRRSAGGLLRRLVGLRLAGAAAGHAALILLSMAVFADRASMFSTTIIYGGTLWTSALMFDWYLRALDRMRETALAAIVAKATFLAAVLLLVSAPGDAPRAAAAAVAAEAAAAFFIGVALWRRPGLAGGDPRDSPPPRSILAEAVPIGLARALRWINYQFDVVLLTFLVAATEVGAYVAAYQVALLPITFGSLFYAAVFPAVARLYGRSPSEVALLLRGIVRAVLLVAPLLAAAVTVAAPAIVELLYGSEYRAAVLPLQLLVWSVVAILLAGPYRNALVATGKQNLDLVLVGAGAAANVALNLLLIPRFGLVGAAVATVAAESVLLVASALVGRHWVPIRYMATCVWAPALASGVVLAVDRAIPGTSGLSIGAALLSGALVLWLAIGRPTPRALARILLASSAPARRRG